MENLRPISAVGNPAPNGPELVSWDSPDDKANPKNWAKARKWRATVSISAFVLMNTLSSTIIAPALPRIAGTLHVTNDAEQLLLLSIFVLGFAFGPFIACPLSEIHGRRRTIQSWNILYLVFNTVCGPVNSASAMLVLRFLAGFFCSASQGVSLLINDAIYQSRVTNTTDRSGPAFCLTSLPQRREEEPWQFTASCH